RLRDEAQDAQPGGVAERAVGLRKRFHIRVFAYLDSERPARSLSLLARYQRPSGALNHAAVRSSPSSNPTRGSHPSAFFAAAGSMTLRRCSPGAGGPCVGLGPPVAFTSFSASCTMLASRAVPMFKAPEAADSTPSRFARATSST